MAVSDAPPTSLKNFVLPPVSEGTATRWDVGVVVSFGYLIPTSMLRHFQRTSINVHPSLLPEYEPLIAQATVQDLTRCSRYRGAAPMQHALLNGDDRTGLSITNLSEGQFDAGQLFKQITVPLSSDMTYATLHDKMAELGATHLTDVISHLDDYMVNALLQRG